MATTRPVNADVPATVKHDSVARSATTYGSGDVSPLGELPSRTDRSEKKPNRRCKEKLENIQPLIIISSPSTVTLYTGSSLFINEVSLPKVEYFPTQATTLPFVMSNFEPWQGQVTMVACKVPSLREHPKWVHLSPIAWNASPTLATNTALPSISARFGRPSRNSDIFNLAFAIVTPPNKDETTVAVALRSV